MASEVPHPPITDRATWLSERKALLQQEKDLTQQMDRVNAARRRLPMVKLEKTYTFDTPSGPKTLLELFEGRRQLVVYHFMFDPEWDAGCPGCTGFADAIGDLSLLDERDTTFTLISRAPLAKLEAYKAEHGWDLNWASSHGSDFNYDFNVTHDELIAPIEYNYVGKEELLARRSSDVIKGEDHGMSVFFQMDGDVYHTYSSYARGVENAVHTYAMLDLTPYGRQEDFEDSPAGWPQKPTYG